MISTIKYKYDSEGNLISKDAEDKNGFFLYQSLTVKNATRSLVTTVSGDVKDAVDWTKNKINDITDGVKKAAIKAKEAVVEAWNRTIKKAIPAVGKFVNETVWKKWIVGGVWETFCKNVAWQMVLSEINRCVLR